MLKLLSSTNGIPVLLDEFKVSDMRADQVDSLQRFMRKAYAGETEQKGHADQTVEDYRIDAPMVVMGEWSVSMPALKERFILVRFSDAVKKNKEMQEAYDRVRNLPLEAFMPGYIEFCLGVDVDGYIEKAADIVDSHFEKIAVAPRIRNNLVTMVVGLELLRDYSGNAVDLEYGRLLDTQLANITGSSTGYVKSAVDQLIEQLGVMVMNGIIQHNIHYKTDDDKLLICFNSVYPMFKEYARRTDYEGEILDRESYYGLFKETLSLLSGY